jgi:hypothetical protein
MKLFGLPNQEWWWRLAGTPQTNMAISNSRFKKQGLKSLAGFLNA